MRSELIIKSRSLGGSSDLTLLAPIKTGLVPSLEAVTYKTRIKRLLKTLNAGRSASHEYALLRPFADAVERVGKIHSVRVAVVEPDKLLLSVTFDGGWESYLRVLWQKVGTLLDLIFCNTEGYVSAWDHRFEEWAAWVGRVQIETDFYYGMPGLTVDDVQYLRNDEMLRRKCPASRDEALESTRMTTRSAEEMAWSKIFDAKSGAINPAAIYEMAHQALRSLALIYRLTGYYLPDGPDGAFLHRAARDLLREFTYLDEELHALDDVVFEGRKRFDEQIDWLRRPVKAREIPKLPEVRPAYDAGDVQGGILSSYADVTHGCLLMIALGSRGAAARFIDKLVACVTRDAGKPHESLPFVNVAFTCEGLRAAGLSERQIELFPQEFREGMEARASLLGDFRTNHPRRWRLPLRNWQRPQDEAVQPVELSTVHMVVQLRSSGGPVSVGETLDESDPLFEQVRKLFAEDEDIELLSVQPMVRHIDGEGRAREHFGFVEALGQPVIDPKDNDGKIYKRNLVQLGEFLLGYKNEAEEPPNPEDAADPASERERQAWLRNGSFLVIRKLRQDVEALNDAVGKVIDGANNPAALDPELVLAKMMGRWRNGDALTGAGQGNDFDYHNDPSGSKCPLHAHIRRANPRQRDNTELPPEPPGRRTPRLMRRGMSYGPAYDPDNPESGSSPRGLVFMAYNASIAEQFEVVQRWISGGNSTGGFSGQSDPFLGVAEIEQQRFFRFEHDGQTFRMPLDGSAELLAEARPLVRLEWGAYLFTPSITALQKLAAVAREANGVPLPAWSAADGWERIQRLFALEREVGTEVARDAWKSALEDPDAQDKFESASVWAAIRKHCGGVLRTPYGVIVADRELVMEVFANQRGLYTVGGYHARMMQSIGEIYLGLDDGGEHCPYQVQSRATNTAIGALKKKDAFELARKAAGNTIRQLIDDEKSLAQDFNQGRWELSLTAKEVVDRVLEAACQWWFGLPGRDEKREVVPGGARWDWRAGEPPLYPGHFTAPSRYFFQPHPGQKVEEFGCDHGQALTEAFVRLVRRHRDNNVVPTAPDGTEAPLAKIIFDAFPDRSQDDLVARTMVGAMMGFLPTVDGNLRLSLNEWLRDNSFWSLRSALAGRDPGTPFENAEELLEPPLKAAMQLRPSPELVWRTATRHHKIGDVCVVPGDKIVVSIVSATQQCLEEGSSDVFPIFGGNRSQDVHPTHACPGYEAAMGLLLGIVSALLEVRESTRPSPAPLVLTLEGPLQKAEVQEFLFVEQASQTGIGTGHVLVAEGDSWFSYRNSKVPWPLQNILQVLRQVHGFEVKGSPMPGRRLQEIAESRLEALCQLVEDLVAPAGATPPLAILLSGGGNDVVKERLEPLLNAKPAAPPQLIEKEIKGAVDGNMQAWLEKTLDEITRRCKTKDGKQIPVFMHGYDFPVPDNRKWQQNRGEAWLYPPLAEVKKYTDLQERIDIMELLIKRLNAMQLRVAALDKFKSHVFHVDLAGKLRPAFADYTKAWDNELHPSKDGFALLTRVFVNEMIERIPTLKARSQALGLS